MISYNIMQKLNLKKHNVVFALMMKKLILLCLDVVIMYVISVSKN